MYSLLKKKKKKIKYVYDNKIVRELTNLMFLVVFLRFMVGPDLKDENKDKTIRI